MKINVTTPAWRNVKSPLTLSKLGVESPPGLLKIQNSIARVKTPRIEVFLKIQNSIAKVKTPRIEVSFILLERSWSEDVQNGLAWTIWTSKLWSKEGSGVKLAIWLPTIKIRNQPDPDACRWSAICLWKALEESYKFDWDLAPIKGRGEKLWSPKVQGVQTGTVSGQHFGSPGKKCHSDVGATERHREYYMGEGGGFPRVRAMVNQVSTELPMACPNTENVPDVI
jgi:hypothetical protein